MSQNVALFMVGPSLDVHHEDGVWWATCPGCPGWSAAADSWDDLFRLVSEAHELPDAPHRGWMMMPTATWTFTETQS